MTVSLAVLTLGVAPAGAVATIIGVTSYSEGTSSKSGPSGTTVTAFATGARPNTQYRLGFAPALPSGEPCPHAGMQLVNPNLRVSTVTGLIGNTSGVVMGPPGTYHLCFYEVGGMSSATAPVLFRIPANPTISTEASAGGILGTPVHDVATLTGGSSPTGTVTFRLHSDAACMTQIFTSTNDLVSGFATSSSFTPTAAGTYYWTAAYSGDANNRQPHRPARLPTSPL